jgi:hypothetical protein
MIEAVLTFRPEEWESYRTGTLLQQWSQAYPRSILFRALPARPKQLPPLRASGFREFFVGVHYLVQGFEVLRCFERKEQYPEVFALAEQLLGPRASDLVLGQRTQKPVARPPHLLMFDANLKFFLSEVQMPTDSLSKTRKDYFCAIERLLNECMPLAQRSTKMPSGHWIESIRLRPSSRSSLQS